VPYPAPALPTWLVTLPLSSKFRQSVIIKTQPGVDSRTVTKAVAQASPDGYTLLLSGTNPNAVALPLYRHLNFEPVKEVAAVALIEFGILMH
jgi:hypothetical protein